ncbi:hypothetical protein AB3R30_08420 [Leptolyngbyaceae cyanobacterium UHCC 1019]
MLVDIQQVVKDLFRRWEKSSRSSSCPFLKCFGLRFNLVAAIANFEIALSSRFTHPDLRKSCTE